MKRESGNVERPVRFRVEPAIHEAFKALCAAEKITVSIGLRRLMVAATHFTPSLDDELRDDIQDLIENWRAIGGNLNQIARAINAKTIIDTEEVAPDIQACVAMLDRQQDLFVKLCAPYFESAGRALREPRTGS